MISGLTFAGCVGYLFFEWARQFSWVRSAEEFERVIEEVVRQS